MRQPFYGPFYVASSSWLWLLQNTQAGGIGAQSPCRKYIHLRAQAQLCASESKRAIALAGSVLAGLRAFSLGNCFLTCVARGADVEKDNILPDRHYTIIDVVRVRILNSLTAPKTLLATDHFPLWPFNLV